MATIVTRAGKGSPLTHTEVDANFTNLNDEAATKAPLASPALTGTPTAPTASVGTNTTQLATTAFVNAEIANDITGKADLASPAFTGVPTAPTASVGTNTTQVATTAFVNAEIANDITGKADLASPAFTGVPTAPTATVGTNTTQLATTAFVIANAGSLNSPAFTGTPTAPTASVGTNTTQLATTAFVNAEIANDAPTKTGGGASGTWGININGTFDSSARSYSREWIEMPNHTGLYSGINGAHFYPNNASYGPWRVDGSRNGWGGIEFGYSGVSLMQSSDGNNSGFHKNSHGWQFYWSSGTLTCFKNTYGGGTGATVLDSVNFGGIIGGMGYGAVGTYGLFQCIGAGQRGGGSTVSGSSLYPTNAFSYSVAGYASVYGTPSGTWRLMGSTGYYSGTVALTREDMHTSVWLRIS